MVHHSEYNKYSIGHQQHHTPRGTRPEETIVTDNQWEPVPHFVDQNEIEEEYHEWGARKILVNRNNIPDSDLSLALVWIIPGGEEDKHHHEDCDQIVHVLSGECEIEMGDTVYSMSIGDTLHIPKGVPHAASNQGWEPVRLLAAFASGSVKTRVDSTAKGKAS